MMIAINKNIVLVSDTANESPNICFIHNLCILIKISFFSPLVKEFSL